MPLLTLFTAPKPFVDPHIDMIQRNALRNWLALGEEIEVVVVGNEPGISEACKELNILHLPDVKCNDLGTPLISSIFDLARQVNNSPYLAYVNADILFLPGILDSLHRIACIESQFLGVGQRWDLDVESPISFTGDWVDTLKDRVQQKGKLHGQTGSDYFIFPRSCFENIPDFAVGRAGWDNWMIFKARWQHWPVVDMTNALTIVHQNHDYRHLPGGVIHFHQPETQVNVRLAGGRITIFELSDATHIFENGKLHRKPLDWQTFWREVEIFPLARLHSRILGMLAFGVMHPVKVFNRIKGWLAYKLNQRKKAH